MTSADGWDTVEDAKMVVTDIAVLSKKEKAPSEYAVIENTHDGKKANFPEGRLGLTTRYICYTKKSASPQRGFVVVSDLRVLPLGDSPPLGFLPLLYTMDDNSKSFHSKQLVVKFVSLEQATEAISDIIIFSGQRKEDVPSTYKRLPEINGFSICFKVGPVPKKKSGTNSPSLQTNNTSNGSNMPGGSSVSRDRKGSAKVKKAIDGLTFKLSENNEDLLARFKLTEQLSRLRAEDVESKYTYDFSKWRKLLNQR